MTIREYLDSDFEPLAGMFDSFQDEMTATDALKLSKRDAGFGEKYSRMTLEKIKADNGKLFVAEEDGKIAGLIAGIVKDEHELDSIIIRRGTVLELFVDKTFRSRKIGFKLMGKMESYFKGQKCELMGLMVLADNKGAIKFYKKTGLKERTKWMIKLI